MKGGLKGTYVAVEPFHLDADVAEQVFRFRQMSLCKCHHDVRTAKGE